MQVVTYRSVVPSSSTMCVAVPVASIDTGFFDDLYGAVANRDRESSLAIIERIRHWLHNIAV